MRAGLIGIGVVGSAMDNHIHRREDLEILRYDPRRGFRNSVDKADVVFISVPVPTIDIGQDTGKQDISILSQSIASCPKDVPIFVRSSVVPGTCDRLAKEYGRKVFAMPEFLTERTANEDFNRIKMIVGIANENAMLQRKLTRMLANLLPTKKIVITTNTEAELTKFAHNCALAIEVTFWNHVREIADETGSDYEKIRRAVMLTGFIDGSHTAVPGPDKKRGYGGKCLISGTRISTPFGTRSIESLKVGDIICDEESETSVTRCGSRFVDELVEVKSRGRKIVGSKDHIHFKYENDKIVETTLENIKLGDWMYLPRPILNAPNEILLGPKPNGHVVWWPERISMNNDLARIIGLYLADGCWTDDEYAVVFSLGEKKAEFGIVDDLIKRFENIGLHATKRFSVYNGTYGESRTWTVRVRSAGFQAILTRLGVGRRARGKRAPHVSKEFIPSLLGGWLDGDGCCSDNLIEGYSESTEMIAKFDEMFRAVGINVGISKEGKRIRIGCREDVQKVCDWTMRLRSDGAQYLTDTIKESPSMRQINGGWITKVASVKLLPGDLVISIETASHRYVANGMLTHNCFPTNMSAFERYYADLFGKSRNRYSRLLRAAINDNIYFREQLDAQS